MAPTDNFQGQEVYEFSEKYLDMPNSLLLSLFYALDFEEVDGAYWFRVVRVSVRASVHQEPCKVGF